MSSQARNVTTSPAQPSIGSCVHANLTVFNCMSPRSMENIASQFTSEKAHRRFSSQKRSICFYIKYRYLLKIIQAVGMGYISSAGQSFHRSQLPGTQPWANLPWSLKQCGNDDCHCGDKVLTDFFCVALRYGTARCPAASVPLWKGREGRQWWWVAVPMLLRGRITAWDFVGLQAMVCRDCGECLVLVASFSISSTFSLKKKEQVGAINWP